MKIVEESERARRKPVKRRLFVDECPSNASANGGDMRWKKRSSSHMISSFGSLVSKQNELLTDHQVRHENGEWKSQGYERLDLSEFEMLSDSGQESDDSYELKRRRKSKHRVRSKIRREKPSNGKAKARAECGSAYNHASRTLVNSERYEVDEDLTLKEDNLPWLLNFRIDKLLDENYATSINHDHSYEQRQTGAKKYTPNSNLILVMGQYSESHKRVRNKPPYTYTELIEFALNEKKESTVAGIYEWIGEHFPFYRNSDERWKNSIRHNLSINPHFKKGRKTETGSHLWKVVVNEEASNGISSKISCRSHWKKQKLHELKSCIPLLFENTEKPTKQNNSSCSIAGDWNPINTSHGSPNSISLIESARNILYGEPEQRVQVITSSHHVVYGDIKPQTWSFEWTPNMGDHSSEFLNPVPITEVVQECGLVTDSLSDQTVVSLPSGTFCTDYISEPTDCELFEFIQPLATP